MRTLYLISLFLTICILSGCSLNTNNFASNNVKPLPYVKLNKAIFDAENIHTITEQEIFHLSAKQQAEFFKYYYSQQKKNIPANKIIANYINDRLSNFTYYGTTFIASRVMKDNKGNCMSLAIFTTALAKLVHVKISYREVKTLPIFEKHSNVLLSSTHVQAILYDPDFVPNDKIIYFLKPSIVIDYFPSQYNVPSTNINYSQFVALYYQNKAADSLVNNKLNQSFAYALKGLNFEDNSRKILNTMAVLHRRMGDLSTAQEIYEMALQNNNEDLSLLNNYIILLKSQKMYKKSKQIEAMLDKVEDPNPYSWLEQAYLSLNKHEYTKAIRYYQKTIDNAPYVHQAYLGLYQIYLTKNQPQKAQKMLEKALEWTHEFEQRKRYKKKLFQLQSS